MKEYKSEKKRIGILHPRYGKLPNGGTLVKPCDSPPPPPPPKQPMVKFKNGSEIYDFDCNEGVRGQRASDLWIGHSVLCHSCKNRAICKFQDDYLEQFVHIIDIYNGVFELNCNHYKTIEALYQRYDDKVLDEQMQLDIHNQHLKIIQNGLK